MSRGEVPAAQVEGFARGGLSLALHRWVPPSPRAAVLYVHGLQSHGGWLFDSAPQLTAEGVALYVLDRRGSGASGGGRGDVGAYQDWVEDHLAALVEVRARHPDVPLTLLGQSFGGSIAAAVAQEARAPHDAVLFCAPGLNRMTSRLSAEERQKRLAERSPALRDIPLEDGWYTRDERWLSFIKADPLMLRRFTGRFEAAVLELEAHGLAREGALAPKPCGMVLLGGDPIIAAPVAKAAFQRLTADRGWLLELPGAGEHYLEFSRWRAPFLQVLASFALRGGFGAPA